MVRLYSDTISVEKFKLLWCHQEHGKMSGANIVISHSSSL